MLQALSNVAANPPYAAHLASRQPLVEVVHGMFLGVSHSVIQLTLCTLLDNDSVPISIFTPGVAETRIIRIRQTTLFMNTRIHHQGDRH